MSLKLPSLNTFSMTFDFLGVTERREVLEGLHFMVACYMSRAVFLVKWEEISQAIALLRQSLDS